MKEIPRIDWMQVKLNIELSGLSPEDEHRGVCWHVDENSNSFCLRAERWSGHGGSAPRPFHDFVSLEDYIKEEVGQRVLKAIEDDRAVRAEQEFLGGDDEAAPPPMMTPFGPIYPTPEELRARKEEIERRDRMDEVRMLTEVLKANPGPSVIEVVDARLIELLSGNKSEVTR